MKRIKIAHLLIFYLTYSESQGPCFFEWDSFVDSTSYLLKQRFSIFSDLYCPFHSHMNTDPVSYTHLDVYKRQSLGCGSLNETLSKSRTAAPPLASPCAVLETWPGEFYVRQVSKKPQIGLHNAHKTSEVSTYTYSGMEEEREEETADFKHQTSLSITIIKHNNW